MNGERWEGEWERRGKGWAPPGHSGKNDYTKLEKLLAREERKGGDQKLPEKRYPRNVTVIGSFIARL